MNKTPCYIFASHTVTPKPTQRDFFMHTHRFFEFYYFMSGKGVFHIEGTAYPLKVGDILIMNSTESHYVDIDPSAPYERMVVHFDKSFVTAIEGGDTLLEAFEKRAPGENNLIRKSAFDSELYKLLINNILTDVKNKVQTETNFYALLCEISKAHAKGNDDVTENTLTNQIIRYILQNLENEFTLDDICREFYVTKQHLCRLFKSSVGSSVWNYVTVKRLLRAKELIDKGFPPTQVYTKCGFSDYSCFYRAYKKFYGTSPSKSTTI